MRSGVQCGGEFEGGGEAEGFFGAGSGHRPDEGGEFCALLLFVRELEVDFGGGLCAGAFEIATNQIPLQEVMYARGNVLWLFRTGQGLWKELHLRTNHLQVRPWTFFENGVVGHIGFADPFDNVLRNIVIKALQGTGVLEGENAILHESGTLICMGMSIFYLYQIPAASTFRSQTTPSPSTISSSSSSLPATKPPSRRAPIFHPCRISPLPLLVRLLHQHVLPA